MYSTLFTECHHQAPPISYYSLEAVLENSPQAEASLRGACSFFYLTISCLPQLLLSGPHRGSLYPEHAMVSGHDAMPRDFLNIPFLLQWTPGSVSWYLILGPVCPLTGSFCAVSKKPSEAPQAEAEGMETLIATRKVASSHWVGEDTHLLLVTPSRWCLASCLPWRWPHTYF